MRPVFSVGIFRPWVRKSTKYLMRSFRVNFDNRDHKVAESRGSAARLRRGAEPSSRAHDRDVRPRIARAFSLIELIVVIIILGVLGGLIAPRMLNMGGRQTQADAQAVAEVLAIAARRDDQTNQPVAIDYDSERGSIALQVFGLGAGVQDGGLPRWRTDRLAPPAVLRGSEVESVWMDGNELSKSKWRIEFSQRSRRPQVVILLHDPRHGDRWRIELAAGSSRPLVLPVGADSDGGSSQSGAIDLDAAGKGAEPW